MYADSCSSRVSSENHLNEQKPSLRWSVVIALYFLVSFHIYFIMIVFNSVWFLLVSRVDFLISVLVFIV